MGVKSLAEGIILQCVEDLWDESLREDCILFLRSEEFRICAELAGICLPEQVMLLDMVKEVLDCRQSKKSPENDRNSNSHKMQTYQEWGSKEMAPCR
jgi:hypothetical protein